MVRHEYFNLWLHSDEELAPLVHEISERATLHQWPLSCVQLLALSDGRKLIYKTAFGPTVEPEFYASAASDLLPWARTVSQFDGHASMLIEFIDAPRVEELDLSEGEALLIGRALLAQIATIEGELPHYVDVRGKDKWEALVGTTAKLLRDLIAAGKLSLVDETTVHELERWACSDPVLSAVCARPGYVHGDLSGDNVFLLPEGLRVIDWQRPVLGPVELDLAVFLESLGFDPLPHVGEAVVRLLKLLRIHWLTQCKAMWIPEGESYDRQIVRLVSELAL